MCDSGSSGSKETNANMSVAANKGPDLDGKEPDPPQGGSKDPDGPQGGNDEPDRPQGAQKRGRGPEDCLNWDDSDEEEFVPFTQARVFTPRCEPKRVYAKKSVVKGSAKGNPAKKSRGKAPKKTSAGEIYFCG